MQLAPDCLPDDYTSSLIHFEHIARDVLASTPFPDAILVVLATSRTLNGHPTSNPTGTHFPSMSFIRDENGLRHFEAEQTQTLESIQSNLLKDGFTKVTPRCAAENDRSVHLIDMDIYFRHSLPATDPLIDSLRLVRIALQAAVFNTQQHLTRTHLLIDSLWHDLLSSIRDPRSTNSSLNADAIAESALSALTLAPQREVAQTIREMLTATFGVQCILVEQHRDPCLWRSAMQDGVSHLDVKTASALLFATNDLHEAHTSQAKRFIHRHHEGINILYAPFALRGVQMSQRFAFLTFADHPLPRILPEVLYGVISRYLREELPEARIRVLAHLSQLALRQATSLPYRHIVKEFDWRRSIALFCRHSFRLILPITNAFAMTLRLYDQSNAHLILHTDETDVNEAPVQQYHRTTAIPLSHEDRSLNVRTFKNCAKHHYRTRARQDQRQPLNPYGAKSEICFPVYFKARVVGTVNVEYSVSEGYIAEKAYLAAVVATIESYLEMLLDANDKYWLMTQIQYEQNVHEAENAIDGLRVSRKRRETIRRLLNRRLGVDAIGYAPLSDLISSFDKEMRARLQPAGSGLLASEITQIAELIAFREPPVEISNGAVPEYWSGLCAIIISNLISNYFKHCDWERNATLAFYFQLRRNVRKGGEHDHLRLTEPPADAANSSRYVFVAECIGTTPFDSTTLDCGTMRPVFRGSSFPPHSRKVSRGLLIVGIIARHLDGFVHIGNRYERSNLRPVVQVILPVPLSDRHPVGI